MNRLGEKINLQQNETLAELEILKAKSAIGNSYQQVLDLPVMENIILHKVMEFYNAILFSAYHVNPLLFIVLSCKFQYFAYLNNFNITALS